MDPGAKLLVRRSNNLDELPVAASRLIVSQQNHRLHSGLCQEKPVERILVNRGKFHDLRGMFSCDGKMVETCGFNTGQVSRSIRTPQLPSNTAIVSSFSGALNPSGILILPLRPAGNVGRSGEGPK